MKQILRAARAHAGTLTLFALMLSVSACSLDSVVGSSDLPPTVVDPAVAKTPEGARAAYNATLGMFRLYMGGGFGGASAIFSTGLFSDELTSGQLGQPQTNQSGSIDSRFFDATTDPAGNMYTNFQRLRGQANQARGLVEDYIPENHDVLVAHLMAVSGYAELMLAEAYCSGIPLSTVDYNGDYTYKGASSTQDVLTHAAALFDSAIVLAADSARILNFARIGKGRALLQLGQFDAAAAAVSGVPDGFQYTLTYEVTADFTTWSFVRTDLLFGSAGTVSDREGINGLPFRSSLDPRLPGFVTLGAGPYGEPIIAPDYPDTPFNIPIANGVEAGLIRAEAALHDNDPAWITMLNALRTNGTFSTAPNANDPSIIDTMWNAGTGGVGHLRPLDLADYATAASRVDLVFAERAYWMFLTAHRLGDLRRLIRQYGRSQATVFPTGPYRGQTTTYGDGVVLPPPATEKLYNPLYKGCLSQGA